MAREEATNTFSEGLVQDLHPLSTPDNLLTDCLNGTIITYNGNEFILQNDQGNFRLRNCRLKENFIPIGVKEYAGILYIVSYNPITEETEIGSYPSQKTIFATNNRENQVSFIPIIEDNEQVRDTYERLSKESKLQMYANSDELQNFKINPGDLFRLGVDKVQTFAYQDIKFSIITDEKELFPIEIPWRDEATDEGYIVPLDTMDSYKFKHVFWEIPGWLVGKYEIAKIDRFNLNIRNIELPEFSLNKEFDLTLFLNAQIETSDPLFINNENTVKDLQIEYTFWIKDNTTGPGEGLTQFNGSDIPNDNKTDTNNVIFVDQSPGKDKGKPLPIWRDFCSGENNGGVPDGVNLQKLNYNDINALYFHNLLPDNNGVEFKGRTKDESIFVSAVPVLRVGNVEIYYEQFRTNLELDLATINDPSEIKVGNNLYKYIVDDNSVTVTFNVQGPFVNNSSLEIWAEIYSLHDATAENILSKLVHNNNNRPLSDVNFFGQNIIDFKFDNFEDPNDNKFVNENMYIWSIVFKQGDNIISRTNKLMIASITMNPNYEKYNQFDNIYLDEWLYNYNLYLKDISFNLTHGVESPIGDNEWSQGDAWINEIKIDYNKDEDKWEQKYTSEFNWYILTNKIRVAPIYLYGRDYDIPFTLHIKKLSQGPLWEAINAQNKITFEVEEVQGVREGIPITGFNLETSDVDFIEPIKFGGEVINTYEINRDGHEMIPIRTYTKIFPFGRLFVPGILPESIFCYYLTGMRRTNGNIMGLRGQMARLDPYGNLSPITNPPSQLATAFEEWSNWNQEFRPTNWSNNERVKNFWLTTTNVGLVVFYVWTNNQGQTADGVYFRNSTWADQTAAGVKGPFIFALFKLANGTFTAIPFWDGNIQDTSNYGKIPVTGIVPLDDGFKGHVDPKLYAGLVQMSQRIFFAQDVDTKIGTFVYPNAEFAYKEVAGVDNFILNSKPEEIEYTGFNIMDEVSISELYDRITKELEPVIDPDTENYHRIDSNNLTYIRRDDSKLFTTMNLDIFSDVRINLDKTALETQLTRLVNFIKNDVTNKAKEEQYINFISIVTKSGYYVDEEGLEDYEINQYNHIKNALIGLPSSGTLVNNVDKWTINGETRFWYGGIGGTSATTAFNMIPVFSNAQHSEDSTIYVPIKK